MWAARTRLDSDVAGLPDLSLYGGSVDFLRVFGRENAFAPYIGIGAGVLDNEFSPGLGEQDFMGQVSIGAFSLAAATASGRTCAAAGHGWRWCHGRSRPMSGHPRGVAVDANGCPQKGSITLEGVTFEYNSAVLKAGSLNSLDDVADGLKKHPRLKVELQGHTDSKGPDAYNLTLSQKRADAVRDYLIKDGVPSTQITAKGYGEGQPIADNATEDGRAKNRRVVMFVIDNPGEVQVEGEGDVK